MRGYKVRWGNVRKFIFTLLSSTLMVFGTYWLGNVILRIYGSKTYFSLNQVAAIVADIGVGVVIVFILGIICVIIYLLWLRLYELYYEALDYFFEKQYD